MDDLGVYTPIFGNIHKATALGCNFDSKTSKASMWHIPHGLTGSDWTGNLWQSHCYCESQLFNADRSAAIKKQNGRHVFYYNCCCSLILTICSIWQRICCHGIRFFQLNNCTRLVGFLHLLASRPTGIANAADPPCLDSNGDGTGQATNGPFAHGDTCEPKCQDGYTRSSSFGWKIRWKKSSFRDSLAFFFQMICVFNVKKSDRLVCLQIHWKSPVEVFKISRSSNWHAPQEPCWRAPLRAIQTTNRIPVTKRWWGRFQLRSLNHGFGIWDFNHLIYHLLMVQKSGHHQFIRTRFHTDMSGGDRRISSINSIVLHPFSTK